LTKKVLSLLLICLFLFSTCVVTFADEANNEVQTQEYVYDYDGIEVTTNVKMTDEQLADLIEPY
jgi:surface polysaccharide O-acyltransferase-like enzyme